MRFLALAPVFAYALLGGVALVILILYLLKPPPRRVAVPSVLLWARIGRRRKHPPARRLLALVLALGSGLALALALTRPEIPGLGAAGQHLTLILDNSPSMAARTRDGHTRWTHAIDQARALLEQSGGATQIRLVDTLGRLGVSGSLERDAALTALARVPAPSWGQVQLPPASIFTGSKVHLFTDGVAQIMAPQRAIVHSVFEPADNVAVTAFDARPLAQDPTRYEALVQVVNASRGDRRVRLLISGGERFSITQDLNVREGETVNTTFDVSDFEGGVLGAAAVCESDAFAFDDLAYTVVPPHRLKRVLLVTDGNSQLEDALRHVPGVKLSMVTPRGYPGAARHDALVLDRFAPTDPPPTGALLLRPPARKWLSGRSKVLDDLRVASWDDAHAVTGGIAWRNLRLDHAIVESATKGAHALVLASGRVPGALVTAGKSRARWVKLGFALGDSNFALQPDFPVFLGNALNWVTESTPVLVRPLGSIEVALPDAQVRDGSGNLLAASVTDQGVVFEAPRADVYTVSAREKRILVVANPRGPQAALINRTRLGESVPIPAVTSAGFWNMELWILLLLFAGALLLVEWAAFTRRITT